MAFWKRRPLLRALILAVLGLGVGVAALPVWFPWILRPLARHWGATYSRYEREGYQRFSLRDITLTNRSGHFEAQQVEAFVPTVWLWRCVAGPRSSPFLKVDSWSWKSGSPAPQEKPPSAYHELQRSGGEIRRLSKWLPQAQLRNGALQLKNETLQLPRASWADGELSARLTAARFGKKAFHLRVAAPSLTPVRLNAAVNAPAFHFHSKLTIAVVKDGVRLQGTALWLSNRIDLNAQLPQQGLVPQSASLRADSFDIPARLLELKHYRNLTGSLEVDWQPYRFQAVVRANAAPEAANGLPIQLEARASGNGRSAQIDAARISAPWLNARLSTPVKVLFTPPYFKQPATLNIQANLAKQPWIPATGKINGQAILEAENARSPLVRFKLSGTGLSSSNITAKIVHLAGTIRWPLAESASLSVESLEIPHAKPLRLKANLQGRGMNLRRLQLVLSGAKASLQLRGSTQFGGKEKKLDVTALALSRSNHLEMHLEKPVQVTFQRNPAVSSKAWTLAIPPLTWSGAGGRLELATSMKWPRTGAFQISARDLDSRLIEDFVRGSVPQARISHLNFTGEWTNGPIAFHLHSVVRWKPRHGWPFAIGAALDSASNGISIQRLSISSATQTVCQIQGLLPVTLEPAGTNRFIHVNEAGALRLHAVTQTNSVVWNEIGSVSGLLLSQPHVQADVSGTLTAPRGRIALQVRRIQFARSQHALPDIDDLNVVAEANRTELDISQCRFLLQNQPVRFTAHLPLREHFWSALMGQRRWPDWRQATAHLVIQNAELAPFVKLAPGILAPQGVVHSDVTLQRGGVLKGTLAISDAATLPLASLGAIQNIRAAIRFAHQTATLANFYATIGGEPVTATGRMPLDVQALDGHRLPPFAIQVRGTNVPLVRKPNLLLRANLDLMLTNSVSGPGLVTGHVTLRDSLFLADLQSLVPGNTTKPAEHPPYFSVTASPWAAWHLNVQVRGQKFMRVQTPVFHGKVSATLKLDNTLENPLAVGEIRISSGAVTFPFGSLDVNQGFVSLTSDNPYHPRLFISAQTQQFGYRVKLEVTGTADNPIVQFSSTPPLSSEQMVMMLTTGQLPAGLGVTTSTLRRAEGVGLFFGRNLLSEFGLGLGEQNRLSFHSGQQISETGRPTYQVDYRISRRWSIIGEYDRFDQYNLNLKWNIYSK